MELTRRFADLGLIPVPVRVYRDGSFDFEKLAKKSFFQNIDHVTSSREQAEAIWHFARGARAIVVLVDGLDKDVLERVRDDREAQAAKAIESLRAGKVALVLATTLDLDKEFDVEQELGLDTITAVLREDLDRFTYTEAVEYLKGALAPKENTPDEPGRRGSMPGGQSAREVLEHAAASERVRDAIDALDRFHDRSDTSLVDPFYLDLIARLEAAERLDDLPRDPDRWRAAIIARYFSAIEDGKIRPSGRFSNPDRRPLCSRGQHAAAAAWEVARQLEFEQNLAVPLQSLEGMDEQALVRPPSSTCCGRGQRRLSFTSDDLGACLVAATEESPDRLLRSIEQAASNGPPGPRHDRFALTALTFWHLEHRGQAGRRAFERLLGILTHSRQDSPRLTAGAIRILSVRGESEEPDLNERLASLAKRCVDALCDSREAPIRDPDASGALRLVHELARWGSPKAHELLWRLATSPEARG